MNRFDIHVNLGSFPGSKRGKKQRFISPKEMDEYFISHGITHSLVLYNRDEYELLRELGSISKTKIYGVQTVMGPTKENPTDESNLPTLDINIEGRSYTTGGYCYGIKLASNRGWWLRDGEVTSGIDYMSKTVDSIVSQVPKNSIVSMHTQGSVKPIQSDSPKNILHYAFRYPNLKFILNHCGDYGPALQVSRPSTKGDFFKSNGSFYKRFISHSPVVKEGLEYCQHTYNIFGDMSCYTSQKGWIVKDDEYTQWAVGSDFPFSENFGIEYTSERNNFQKWTLTIPDNNAVKFFESNIEELIEWCHERNLRHNELGREHRKKIKMLKTEKEEPGIHHQEERMIIGRVDYITDEIVYDYFEEYALQEHKDTFKNYLSQAILDLE
jgi:hypothetical protein